MVGIDALKGGSGDLCIAINKQDNQSCIRLRRALTAKTRGACVHCPTCLDWLWFEPKS